MGLGGSWHCAFMCGPLCAAQPGWGLLIGRTVGYAAVGAAVASAASWGSEWTLKAGADLGSPWLTLWALAHAAAISLGVFLMWQGRQPLWLVRWGAAEQAPAAVVTWARARSGGVPSAAIGVAWAALPCGLLQSAWVLAALSPDAWGGAAVMVVFSLSTAPALVVAPVVVGLLRSRHDAAQWQVRLTRVSGLMLASASAWALSHGLWVHVRAVC